MILVLDWYLERKEDVVRMNLPKPLADRKQSIEQIASSHDSLRDHASLAG